MTSQASSEAARRRVFRPNADIYETADGVTLELELPGVAPEDVDVTLEQQVLTIRGKRRREPREGLELAYAEFGEGDFERVFSVSRDIDPDGLSARFSQGLLTLKLPRSGPAGPRKIKVQAG